MLAQEFGFPAVPGLEEMSVESHGREGGAGANFDF